MHRRSTSRGRGGWTVLELVIAMMIFGIAASIALPATAESMRIARIDRASRAIAISLEQALGLAARQRAPVQIRIPDGTRRMVISDLAEGTVYANTDLSDDTQSGVRVDRLRMEPVSVNVFPTGQTSAAVTVTLISGDHTRTVTMSRAGQIRVF